MMLLWRPAGQPMQFNQLVGSEVAMRHPASIPADPPLPLPHARSANSVLPALPIDLSNEAMVHFNALLHELYPDAPRIDVDTMAALMHWLDSQSPQQRQYLLQARLNRIDELKALRNDPSWPLEPAQVKRIDKLIRYVTENNDLIPDDTPVFGLLDDALLIELVWPILADELDDYCDFCRYCEEINGEGQSLPTQEGWVCIRREEGALWQQLQRVRDQHYIEYQLPTSLFRVS